MNAAGAGKPRSRPTAPDIKSTRSTRTHGLE